MEQVTDLARQMVTRWGMSDRLGPAALAPRGNPFLVGAGGYADLPGAKPYSETTATLIDQEVQRILQEGYEDALRLLQGHRTELDALVRALLDKETLDEEEILAVTGLRRAPRLAAAPLAAPAPGINGAAAAG
jgi:cell division protease FtsH